MDHIASGRNCKGMELALDHITRGEAIAKVWEWQWTILQGSKVLQRYGNDNGPYYKEWEWQ